MLLNDDDIHIWFVSLKCSPEQERAYAHFLSPDEMKRAERYRFPEHQRRFIVSRAVIRQILSFYLNIAPEKISFSYGEHGKPALLAPLSGSLEFNVAHSDDLAVYAVARHPVGIDIEKIKDSYELGLPARFFSSDECESLQRLSEVDRVVAFYQIWARKEAIIKASGKGLATSLSSFSVCPANVEETIQLANEVWQLWPLEIDGSYASALATLPSAKKLLFYNFADYVIKI